MRPIGNLFDPSMLDGIEMDVIDVMPEIVFVGDGVFPIPSLP